MNVTINITTTAAALPSGVIAGLLALSITDSAGHPINDASGQPLVSQQVSGNTATFANVLAGDYIASAVRLDTNGTPIGSAVTQAFSVPAATASVQSEATANTATYDAPQSITVTVA